MHTLLIDGYNVIHGVPSLRQKLDLNIGESRASLIHLLAGLASAKKGNVAIHVFFDGAKAHDGFDSEPFVRGVDIHFSRGQNADQDILDFLHRFANKAEVTVVTDDRNLAYQTSAEGAEVLSSSGLARRLAKVLP